MQKQIDNMNTLFTILYNIMQYSNKIYKNKDFVLKRYFWKAIKSPMNQHFVSSS